MKLWKKENRRNNNKILKLRQSQQNQGKVVINLKKKDKLEIVNLTRFKKVAEFPSSQQHRLNLKSSITL